MRLRRSRYLKHLRSSILLLGATAGVLAGTTSVLAGTGLPLGASTACGCALEPLPNKTLVEGLGNTVEGNKEIARINWSKENPIMTHGCKGGKVTTTTEGKNIKTGLKEHRESTLTEDPSDPEDNFTGNIPVMYPVHGKGILTIKVTGCEHSSEEIEIIITCYIDPSGTVVDANHEKAPVWEATVTLLRSETELGTYTAVPNGSEIMSPANRVNPDKTRADGSFGWEVTEAWYKVEASKTGCGTATTPAFFIGEPVENLVIELHCEGEQWKLGEEGGAKAQLAVKAPTKECEGNVRVENVSFGTAAIKVLKETGIECTIKKKGCETKTLNKAEKCESELEKPGTKPEYELEVEWNGKKFTKKFSV